MKSKYLPPLALFLSAAVTAITVLTGCNGSDQAEPDQAPSADAAVSKLRPVPLPPETPSDPEQPENEDLSLSNPNDIGYYPGVKTRLGRGIIPEFPTREMEDCFEFEKVTDSGGAPTSKYQAYLVSSAQEVKQALGIDVQVDVRFLLYGGGSVSAAFNESSVSRSTNATMVIKAFTEYPSETAERLRLKPEYQRLLDEKKFRQFERRCGTHLVKSQRRQVALSAILTISSMSREEQRMFRSHIEGSYGTIDSVSASVDLNTMLQRAIAERRASIDLHMIGGDGLISVSDLSMNLLSSQSTLQQIGRTLAEAMKSLSAQSSVPISSSVIAMPLSSYQSPSITDIPSEKITKLQRLVTMYRSTTSTYQSASNTLSDRSAKLPEEIRAAADKDLSTLGTFLRQLRILHEECLKESSEDCEIPSLPSLGNIDRMFKELNRRQMQITKTFSANRASSENLPSGFTCTVTGVEGTWSPFSDSAGHEEWRACPWIQPSGNVLSLQLEYFPWVQDNRGTCTYTLTCVENI